MIRLAPRNRELAHSLLCSLALTALAISLQLWLLLGNPLPPSGGGAAVALTWAALPSRGAVLRLYLAFSPGLVTLMFGIVGLAA